MSNIPAGTYAVCYISLPGGYQIIYPTITPPSYIVTVGSSCSTDTAHGSSCSSGSIINLNFAILLYGPWIQSTGTDIRLIPDLIIIFLARLLRILRIRNGGGVSNGIIFTGGTNVNFGAGSAGQTTNWVVGGGSYPELFIPSKGNVIRTSYNYMNAQIKQAGLTATDLSTKCALTNCNLSNISPANFPHGLYSAGSDLIFNANGTPASFTFQGAVIM